MSGRAVKKYSVIPLVTAMSNSALSSERKIPDMSQSHAPYGLLLM